jgi:ketosteroid isomerase-like protein
VTGSAARTAQDYVDAVNAADGDGLIRLFAADAVLNHPTGRFEGPEAIRGFYEDLVFAGRAVLTMGRILTDDEDRVAMFELSATSPLAEDGQSVRTVDVLELDARGRVRALGVYYG